MSQKAATTQKTITRGPRKGQVITVYVKSGTEVRSDVQLVRGSGTNRQKGNPRAGKKFTRTTNAAGQKLHVYADGTQVVVSKTKKTKGKDGLNLVRTKSSQADRKKILAAAKAGKVKRTPPPKRKPPAKRKKPAQKRT